MAIGSRILRSEDRPLLTGAARFVDDIHLDGALEAAFLRSPAAHGRLLDPGVGAVSGLPGVEAVFAAADLGLGPLQPPNENPAISPPPQPVLATEMVRFAGAPIAIVVAGDRYAAEDARDAAVPEIEELEALVDPRRALAEDAPQIHDGRDNLVVDMVLDEGDVEGALGAADVVIERTLRTPRLSALPIEGRAGSSAELMPCWANTTRQSPSSRLCWRLIPAMCQPCCNSAWLKRRGGAWTPRATGWREPVTWSRTIQSRGFIAVKCSTTVGSRSWRWSR